MFLEGLLTCETIEGLRMTSQSAILEGTLHAGGILVSFPNIYKIFSQPTRFVKHSDHHSNFSTADHAGPPIWVDSNCC